MTTALTTVGPQTVVPQASLAFEPSDIGQGVQLAKLLVASRLLPRGIATPEAAFTVIMTGRELGLTAMQSIRSIHVIDGKPTMSADLMVALTKRSPACEFLRIVESNTEIATYETRRRGETEPTRISFTIDDAKAAGLLGRGPWKQYPAAMLRARCAAAICRAVYPDLMLGVYETDELAGGGSAPDVEPVRYEQVRREEPEAEPLPIAAVAEQAQRVADAATPPPSDDGDFVSVLLSLIAKASTRDEVANAYKSSEGTVDEETRATVLLPACKARVEAIKAVAA